jgi:beta-glucosidase
MTQERRQRPSAAFYADICRRNALTSEAVAQYAPEVFEDLFPAAGTGGVAFFPPSEG